MISSTQLEAMSPSDIEQMIEQTLRHLVARDDRSVLPVLVRLAQSTGTAVGSAAAWVPSRVVEPPVGTERSVGVEPSPGIGASTGALPPAMSGARTATFDGIRFYGIREPQPGPRWRTLFDATWSGYRSWYLSEGDSARPGLAQARQRLSRHMPELVDTWERLVDLVDRDETAARMLTLWNPPRFLPGCSQAVLTGETPTLIRNYDYRPDLCERVVYSSAFTGRRVIGTGDCLWGLLDGMNDAGLVVSLTFGGSRATGDGFGIPLVVRYVLEVAETVAEAIGVLSRVPVNMAYNLTVLDTIGEVATVFVAPGAEPEVLPLAVATNHRGTVPDWPEHARAFRSVQRQQTLLDLLATDPQPEQLLAAFLQPPLYNTAYAEGFGTMYTAVYRPDLGTVDYVWPGSTWRRSFESADATHTAVLGGAGMLPKPA